MKLTYRGVNYESSVPNMEMTEGGIGGQYRGVNWKQRYPRHIPVPQPVVGLKYRGASYSLGHPIDVEASLVRRQYTETAKTQLRANQVSTASSRQRVLEELNHTHIANIRQNLEHRLQVARARGDKKLIQMLEVEAEQLVTNK
ncbi:DUF4278 domain-containing protein [Chroogloeocystis siderophila]|jgi:hypothetical protein|uniref:DUF4278 domain-containing protein n=1 Tax=Chroogloeocystis siderophila 5.2 s.c.1 TaxID=247279 RepID=A0A1U7HXW5_9CHRO|nr:DUF4278 domain-containing protein [Chroogloeocystis siderophila]OKH28463.1 hypothetical protein NIES1031_04300 [Chroogloeocystis siderophila 5.2 s.c.1]